MNVRQQKLNRIFGRARRAYRSAPESHPEFTAPELTNGIIAQWRKESKVVRLGDVLEGACWWGAGVAATLCLGSYLYARTIPEPNVFDILLDAPIERSELI